MVVNSDWDTTSLTDFAGSSNGVGDIGGVGATKRSVAESLPAEAATHRHIVLIHQAGDGELSTINYKLFRRIRSLLDKEIHSSREHTEIDVWLDSGGGDASAAYKIALLLRSRAKKLRVVVPDYAKSAATLLSLAADEIYMAEAAELGPLDAQIGYEKVGITISALDVARSLEDLAEKGISMALSGGAAVLETTQLSRAESLGTMVDFATKFMSPVIDKLDPTMIHWSSSLLNESAQYAKRLIRMRHKDKLPVNERLRRLPEDLVGLYPAHGFIISRDEARDLGLPVVDLERYDYCEVVKKLAWCLDDEEVNCINMVRLSENGQLLDNPLANHATTSRSADDEPF